MPAAISDICCADIAASVCRATSRHRPRLRSAGLRALRRAADVERGAMRVSDDTAMTAQAWRTAHSGRLLGRFASPHEAFTENDVARAAARLRGIHGGVGAVEQLLPGAR